MDSGRGKSVSPTRNRKENHKDVLPKNQRSLPSSFRRKSLKPDVKHFTDLDVLREAQCAVSDLPLIRQSDFTVTARSVQNKGSSGGVNPAPSMPIRKIVAPIGGDSRRRHDTDAGNATMSRPGSTMASVIGRNLENLTIGRELEGPHMGRGLDGASVVAVLGNNRPLHHSLPSKLTPPLAPPPSALGEHGRKNSRVTLTPLDHRKISAP